MQVTVDNIWASQTVLHLRVTVWVEGKWRHKYDVAVPIATIPEEALAAAWIPVTMPVPVEVADTPLF